MTDRVELSEIEMQGTVPAPLKCSIQIDTLGKECLQSGEGLYKYKECVNIPPLAMIDDILAVSECSEDFFMKSFISLHSSIQYYIH